LSDDIATVYGIIFLVLGLGGLFGGLLVPYNHIPW
jgi:hypothetical protein